jgi:hypothetical protein
MIIVDEISFASSSGIFNLHEKLTQLKQLAGEKYGGLHVESKRNLKTPVKTRTLHLSEPYDSRSTPHTAMQPRKE